MANNTIFGFSGQFNLDSPLGNWHQQQNQLITNVDLPRLLQFLKSNKGKRTAFDGKTFEAFTTNSYLIDGEPILETVPTQIPFQYPYSDVFNETRTLSVHAELNSILGDIDLAREPDIFRNFDFKNQKLFSRMEFYYRTNLGEPAVKEPAITLSFEKFIDLIDIVSFLNYEITSLSKEKILFFFKNAFAKANEDGNTLDWLYEEAPAFVLQEIEDKDLIKHLTVLSTLSINSSGSNENISILKILKFIKNTSAFIKGVNDDPSVLQTCLKKFSKKYIEALYYQLILISIRGALEGPSKEIPPANFYILNLEELNLDGDDVNEVVATSYCVYQRDNNTFLLGYNVNFFETGSAVRSESSTKDLAQLKAFDLISISSSDPEMKGVFINSLIAEHLTGKKIDRERKIAINNALFVLLPDFYLLRVKRSVPPVNKNKLKILKKQADLLEFLANMSEDLNFKAIDLDEVGISVVFRGTTRTSKGFLYPGNPNTIQNGVSVSTDPIKAVLFGLESSKAHNTPGVFQVALTKELKDILLNGANWRVKIEAELVLKVSADKFAQLSKIEIPVEVAAQKVKDFFNIDLKDKLLTQTPLELLQSLPFTSLKESHEFYKLLLKTK